MRKVLIPSILVFAALVSPLSAQRKGAGSGGGSVTFAVAVTDPSGAPVSDVKVSVTGAAARTLRTEGGRIVFERLPLGAYRMTFEKTGFVTLERELTGRGGKPIDVKVTLMPVPASPALPSSPPPLVAGLPPAPADAKLVVLDMPAFIEKNYVGRAAGKTTPLGCATGGPATLMQINEPVAEHAHQDGDEFIYVIAGQGMAQFGERKEPLGPAVFLMIPRRMAHTLTAGPKKPLVLVSIRAGEKCGS
jgi:mannose-6-phosphate isomerase-like protein (cupin superfamily)